MCRHLGMEKEREKKKKKTERGSERETSERKETVMAGAFICSLYLLLLNFTNLTSSAISTAETELPREKAVGSSGSMSSDFSGIDKRKGKGGGGKSLIFFANVPKEFDLDDLLRASAEVLGKGSSGTTYKAILETGMAVAVKRLKDVSALEKEFREKIEEIGRINHENLVHLKAYYYSKDEKLLVYDYIPMGSLSALLHGTCMKDRSNSSLVRTSWQIEDG